MASRMRRPGEPFKLYRMRLKSEEKKLQKKIHSGIALWNSSAHGAAERAGTNNKGKTYYRKFQRRVQ